MWQIIKILWQIMKILWQIMQNHNLSLIDKFHLHPLQWFVWEYFQTFSSHCVWIFWKFSNRICNWSKCAYKTLFDIRYSADDFYLVVNLCISIVNFLLSKVKSSVFGIITKLVQFGKCICTIVNCICANQFCIFILSLLPLKFASAVSAQLESTYRLANLKSLIEKKYCKSKKSDRDQEKVKSRRRKSIANPKSLLIDIK